MQPIDTAPTTAMTEGLIAAESRPADVTHIPAARVTVAPRARYLMPEVTYVSGARAQHGWQE